MQPEPPEPKPLARTSMLREFQSVLTSRLTMTAFSFAAGVVVARAVGAEGKGILAALAIYPQIVGSILSMGLRQAGAHFIGGSDHDRQEVTSTLLSLLIITVVVGCAASSVALLTLPKEEFSPMMVALSVATFPVTVAANYSEGFFVGQRDLKSFNQVNLLRPVLTFVASCILVWWLGYGVYGALVANILASLGLGYMLVRAVGRTTRFRPRLHRDLAVSMLKLGFVSGLTLAFLQLNFRVDVVLLEWLSSKEQVGQYALASHSAETLLRVPAALSIVIWSRSAGTEKNIERKVMKAIRVSSPVLAILCLGFAIGIEWLVPWVYGEAFRGSIGPTRWLLPGIIAIAIFSVVHHDLVGKGRPHASLACLVVGCVINVVLNLLLIPEYGANGASMASSVSYTVIAVMITAYYMRSLELGPALLFSFQEGDFAFVGRVLHKLRPKRA